MSVVRYPGKPTPTRANACEVAEVALVAEGARRRCFFPSLRTFPRSTYLISQTERERGYPPTRVVRYLRYRGNPSGECPGQRPNHGVALGPNRSATYPLPVSVRKD